jgi:hypothetical protein
MTSGQSVTLLLNNGLSKISCGYVLMHVGGGLVARMLHQIGHSVTPSWIAI